MPGSRPSIRRQLRLVWSWPRSDRRVQSLVSIATPIVPYISQAQNARGWHESYFNCVAAPASVQAQNRAKSFALPPPSSA